MMSRSTHFQRNTRALSRIGALAEGDLRIGGEIRTHYKPDGQLGDAEGIVNEILAFEPERMLAIRVKRRPRACRIETPWRARGGCSTSAPRARI